MLVTRALRHFRSLRGGSRSQLIQADDGNLYVVKFLQNPQGAKILFNEWIATSIAQRLRLDVPECAVVEVDADFFEAYLPTMLLPGVEAGVFTPGMHYGSRFAGGLLPDSTAEYLPESMADRLINRDAFVGALVMDKWLCNADNRQAVFTKPRGRRYYTAHLIDHGFCLNANAWCFSDAPLRGTYYHTWVYNHVAGWGDFEPWLELARQIDGADLWAIIMSMPPEWWYGFRDQLDSLTDLLSRRVTKVPSLIEEYRRAKSGVFPNWA